MALKRVATAISYLAAFGFVVLIGYYIERKLETHPLKLKLKSFEVPVVK